MKDLNFVPGGDVYNRTQLKYKLNEFFWKSKTEWTL